MSGYARPLVSSLLPSYVPSLFLSSLAPCLTSFSSSLPSFPHVLCSPVHSFLPFPLVTYSFHLPLIPHSLFFASFVLSIPPISSFLLLPSFFHSLPFFVLFICFLPFFPPTFLFSLTESLHHALPPSLYSFLYRSFSITHSIPLFSLSHFHSSLRRFIRYHALSPTHSLPPSQSPVLPHSLFTSLFPQFPMHSLPSLFTPSRTIPLADSLPHFLTLSLSYLIPYSLLHIFHFVSPHIPSFLPSLPYFSCRT